MGYLVVVLLSVLWLVFFLPSLLRARRSSSPLVSATAFQQSIRRLGEGTAAIDGRKRVSRVVRQRRVTLTALAVAQGASLVVAVTVGGRAVWSVVPATTVLVGYVCMLRLHVVRSGRPARPTVRVLPPEEVVIPSVRRRAGASAMEAMEQIAS